MKESYERLLQAIKRSRVWHTLLQMLLMFTLFSPGWLLYLVEIILLEVALLKIAFQLYAPQWLQRFLQEHGVNLGAIKLLSWAILLIGGAIVKGDMLVVFASSQIPFTVYVVWHLPKVLWNELLKAKWQRLRERLRKKKTPRNP